MNDLEDRELATILAGLRLFQVHRQEGEQMDHFEGFYRPGDEDKTDLASLNDDEIDALCDRLNR